MREIKFKRGDIIQHQDGSLYVVKGQENEGLDPILCIATIIETATEGPPTSLRTFHIKQCVKVGHVND